MKEYYYYLDSTPTHSYMKCLYKYPQAEFPYKRLLEANASRSRQEPEYELLDTGIFDENRYFDIFAEYAKVDANDILIRISVANRGPEAATLHLLPTLWFRNTWTWDPREQKPVLRRSGRWTRSRSTPSRRIWARTGSRWMEIRRCCSPKMSPTPRRCGAWKMRART